MRSGHDTDKKDSLPRLEEECAELLLLLPSRHWAALGSAAGRQGLTIGSLLRRLVAVYLGELDDAWVPAKPSLQCVGPEGPDAGSSQDSEEQEPAGLPASRLAADHQLPQDGLHDSFSVLWPDRGSLVKPAPSRQGGSSSR